MTGIQFLTDEKGRKVAVQIDLRKHGALWEDFYDGMISERRRKEKGVQITRSLGPPVLPSSTILDAIVQTAAESYLPEPIGGPSPSPSTDWIAMHARAAWEKLTEKPKSEVCFRIIEAKGKTHDFLI